MEACDEILLLKIKLQEQQRAALFQKRWIKKNHPQVYQQLDDASHQDLRERVDKIMARFNEM